MYLSDLTVPQLKELLGSLNEPKYRADQVYGWLVRGVSPENMTNLPKSLREKLSAIPFGGVGIYQKRASQKDGTNKYLFELEDENLVEGVLMRYHYGNTACLSTQVGCNMGCKFCASTLDGCVRNLRPGEIRGQIAAIEQDEGPTPDKGRAVTNLVLMGSGEPLDNYENVVAFLRDVTCPESMGISPRNISVSTCGIVPKMYTFAVDAPPVTLSVSLHAHSDDQRSEIMPVNKAYPIAAVIGAARYYAQQTGRRVIFEYALIDGFNASEQDAQALSEKLGGMLCHVNLIPLNPVPERGLKGVTRAQAAQFMEWLTDRHISATVRREMGTDIEGACGQLRRRVLHEIRS